MSAFDTARDMRLPGVVVENVYLDPTKLSTRMKNAVKKMLRAGSLEGGWGSKSKQLAQKLSDCYDLRLIYAAGWGFTVPPRHTYDETHIARIMEIIDADEALEVMEDAQTNMSKPYVEQIIARTRERHEHNRQVVRSDCQLRWLRPSGNKELMDQLIDVFVSTRTPELIEKAERVCDMIDRGERIAITINM